MLSIRDLVLAFRQLELDGSRPALVHSSLSSFGQIQGGAKAVTGALLQHFNSVAMPAFTYRTMIIPESGPADNAIHYGSQNKINQKAIYYDSNMPVDRLMGIIPETLRRMPQTRRSRHPILSFIGVNADKYLKQQTRKQPLAPISAMMEDHGWVVMMGVGHTANTSIHLGEKLAGRKSFTRWALVPGKVVTCPNFPACSDGFDALQPHLAPVTRAVQVGSAWIQALPISLVVRAVEQLVSEDPLALLCERENCPRCNAIRKTVEAGSLPQRRRPGGGGKAWKQPE